LFTTITGIVIALVLANTIKPGSKVNNKNNTTMTAQNEKNELPKLEEKFLIINTIFDLIRYEIISDILDHRLSFKEKVICACLFFIKETFSPTILSK
jgi:Na+/H+-dicarboxylate symporter